MPFNPGRKRIGVIHMSFFLSDKQSPAVSCGDFCEDTQELVTEQIGRAAKRSSVGVGAFKPS